MSGTASTSVSVVVSRWFPATREAVYQAFTDPARLTRWFSPSDDVATTVVDFDLRLGGRYRLAFHFPQGHTDYVVGKYLEISPSRRLVYTWTWEQPDPFAGIDTTVTVELSDSDGGTIVAVTHDRFPSEERRGIHEIGWQATLARLARLFEPVDQPAHNRNSSPK